MHPKISIIRCICVILMLASCYSGATILPKLGIGSDSAWSTNRTAVAESQRVRFADIGDFGLAGSTEAAVAQLVRSWQPDFIITNGDNNYQHGEAATIDENIGQYYHEYIYPYLGKYGTGATENRFFPALGDHDWYSLSCTNGSCTGPYFDYFALPGNERYYDFVKGPVHIFILDNNKPEPDGYRVDSIQAKWLQTQLAAAKEPWKIVVNQQPPYSSGSVHGSVQASRWPYKAWGANLVLSGNEHNYERLTVDGMAYIVNGAGGVSLYGFANPLAGSEVRYNANYGALLIDADAQTLTGQFINIEGTVIDTFTLNVGQVTPEPTPLSPMEPSPTPTVAPDGLGDWVWRDDNGNGIQDAGEPGVAGVSVKLLLGSTGKVAATTTTDDTGHYLFSDLQPGAYRIQFTLLPGYTFSPQDQGNDDNRDSDANPSTGRTVTTNLTGAESKLRWDAGFAPLPSNEAPMPTPDAPSTYRSFLPAIGNVLP